MSHAGGWSSGSNAHQGNRPSVNMSVMGARTITGNDRTVHPSRNQIRNFLFCSFVNNYHNNDNDNDGEQYKRNMRNQYCSIANLSLRTSGLITRFIAN